MSHNLPLKICSYTDQMLSQIEFSCVSGAWSETVGSLSSRVMTPPNADLTTATRRDCEFCLDSDPTHCTGKLELVITNFFLCVCVCG